MSPVLLLDFVFLALAAWPLVRLIGRRDFRQIAPLHHAALVALLVLGIALAVALALTRPLWLHVATITLVLMALWAAWFARVSYGRDRGLPPGSFSLWESLEGVFDFWFYREQFRRHGPVFKMLQFNQPTICVLGLERAHHLMREYEAELGPATLPFTEDIEGTFMRYMDGETHATYGRLFQEAINVGVATSLRPRIAERAREELAQAAELDRSSGGRGVSLDQFFERIVFTSFLETLFGFSPGSEASESFHRIYAAFEGHSPSKPLVGAARESFIELGALVMSESERMRGIERPEGSPSIGWSTCWGETLNGSGGFETISRRHPPDCRAAS
jgi:hypothetical protein